MAKTSSSERSLHNRGAQQAAPRVCVAEIKGVFGIQGAVRLASFTENADSCFTYAPFWIGERPENAREQVLTPETWRKKGPGFVVTFREIATREQAEGFKGVSLYVDRDKLPPPEEDDFYHADLIGLKVHNLQGELLGHVHAVHNFGAGDILEITPQQGPGWMIPFSKSAVVQLDLKTGLVLGAWEGADLPGGKPKSRD